MKVKLSSTIPTSDSVKKIPSQRKQSIFRTFVIIGCLLIVLTWAALPAVRAFTLLANPLNRYAPSTSGLDIPVQEVHFQAIDGIHLAGWLSVASPQAPTIILVHGFKGSRKDMLPWAHFLYAGGYNVLLYDSRGCGESEGWGISLGAREPDDVLGAVRFLKSRSDLKEQRFGLLGISLGAGIALMAAAREPAIAATVADSAWVDESAQIDRMGSIGRLPVLPYEPALVDAMIGDSLASARPLDVIGHISPRAVFLIHSADDSNTTTPLAGERKLYAAAGNPKQQWIAPHGNHVGAIQAYHDEYVQRVLAFFNSQLGKPPGPPSPHPVGPVPLLFSLSLIPPSPRGAHFLLFPPTASVALYIPLSCSFSFHSSSPSPCRSMIYRTTNPIPEPSPPHPTLPQNPFHAYHKRNLFRPPTQKAPAASPSTTSPPNAPHLYSSDTCYLV